MKAAFWVKIAGVKRYASWDAGAMELRKSKPDTKSNEVAVKIEIELPDALFEKPQLTAKVTIPDNQLRPVIDATVQENIAEILSEQLGMRVHISADQPED